MSLDRALRPHLITLVAIGIVVVLPLTFFFGALANLARELGACGSVCDWFSEGWLVVFALIPLGYGYWAWRWLQRQQRHLEAGDEVAGAWSIVWTAAAAILLVALALVVTCFGLLGLFSV